MVINRKLRIQTKVISTVCILQLIKIQIQDDDSHPVFEYPYLFIIIFPETDLSSVVNW
jgi:hypothetical protein